MQTAMSDFSGWKVWSVASRATPRFSSCANMVPRPSPEAFAEFIIGRRFAPTRWLRLRPLPARAGRGKRRARASPHTNARAFAIVRARHISQPGAREQRHGKGSDAQQQGKEETEGRQEPQEGRRDAVAVLVRQGADAGRPEPLQQEELRSGV